MRAKTINAEGCEFANSKAFCSLNKKSREIINKLNDYLENKITSYQVDISEEEMREKRGIQILGDFYNWCCNLITKEEIFPLYDNQERMNRNYKELRGALIDSHADLFNISTKLNNFTREINEGFKNIHETFNIFLSDTLRHENNALDSLLKTQELTVNTLNVLQKHILIDHFRDVLEHCKNHKIPAILLSPQILGEDLKELDKKLFNEKLTLAIPHSNIMAYFTHPLATCHLSQDEILINVKIPLISLTSVGNFILHNKQALVNS